MGKNSGYVTLWIISLSLGLFGCLIVSLLVPSYHPQFSTFFRQDISHVGRALGRYLVAAEQEKLSRYNINKAEKSFENERKMFLRHAIKKRLNVSTYHLIKNKNKKKIGKLHNPELLAQSKNVTEMTFHTCSEKSEK